MQNHKPHFALTENSPTEPTVTEAYRDLNKAIDDMDKKVEHVIKKHEAQFLYAYRNHISKIKKQLAQIKHKSQQQQKMFSSNDRIQYLQKQMIIFREQALKLYAKLDEKTQQNQYYKNRIKQLQKEHHNIVSNQKEQIKTSKLEEMNKGILQNKIQQLQQILKSKDQLIARYNAKIQGLKEESLRRSQFDNKDHRSGSITSSLKKGSQSQRYSARKQLIVHDSQMKQWFLQCIKTVKRQVVMRNNNHNMMDLSHINSIQQFKTLDKLRLLEVFLQNEKLLTWMYQRIFPDRLSKLRSNLSAYQSAKIERPTQQPSMVDIQKNMLPKVNKLGKSDYRNNIIIKNGKLNISMA